MLARQAASGFGEAARVTAVITNWPARLSGST
jgi:hypothetical protein